MLRALLVPLLSLLNRDGKDAKENKSIVIPLSLVKSGHFSPFSRAQAVLFVDSKHVFGSSGSFVCSRKAG